MSEVPLYQVVLRVLRVFIKLRRARKLSGRFTTAILTTAIYSTAIYSYPRLYYRHLFSVEPFKIRTGAAPKGLFFFGWQVVLRVLRVFIKLRRARKLSGRFTTAILTLAIYSYPRLYYRHLLSVRPFKIRTGHLKYVFFGWQVVLRVLRVFIKLRRARKLSGRFAEKLRTTVSQNKRRYAIYCV